MSITINITGDSASHIRQQMIVLLGIDREQPPMSESIANMDSVNINFDPRHPDKDDFGELDPIDYLKTPVAEPEATQEAVQRDEPVEAAKPKRTRKASVRPPVAETEAIAAPVEEAAPAPVVNGHDEEAQKAKTSEIAQLMAVKNRAMSALQDAFAAGKVAQCRDLLNKYGEGAKSFRELDLPQFVDLDKAIQGGALA